VVKRQSCKSASTCLTSCESPFARLSAFATTLMAALEQLEVSLNGSESEARLKVSSDGSPLGPLLSELPEQVSGQEAI
jgi:hypothetical protein